MTKKIDFDDLDKNPQMHGFTKIFRCDRCKSEMYCTPDFDPPGCGICNPELYNKEIEQ